MGKMIITHRNQGSSSGVTLGQNASENVLSLQAILDSKGDISFSNKTPALINNTAVIGSNTAVKNLKVKLSPNTNKNILQNSAFNGAAKIITTITNTTLSIGGALAVIATVTVANHGKLAGDYVFINGVSPDRYNGIWKIHAVTDVNTFTYILAYDVGDTIAAGTGTYMPYLHTVNSYTVNSLNTTSGLTAVTGTGFTVGTAWQGKALATVIGASATTTPVLTILGTIATVDSATGITLSAGASATVTARKWVILEQPAMHMYSADYDITIDASEFDYDAANQTTPDTYLKHGIYLRRVKKLSLTNVNVSNAAKYAIAIANCYDVTVNGIDFDTWSDGVHFLGSGDNITVSNVRGKTGDDFCAIGNSDYYQYLDPNYAFGDFGNVTINNLMPKSSLTGFKYYGCVTNTIKDLTIETSGGTISGGNGLVLLITDGNVVGAEAGYGSTVKRASISTVWDQNSSKSALLCTNVIVDNLITPKHIIGLGNTAGTSCGILVNGNSLIKRHIGGSHRYYSSSGGFANNAAGIRTASTSRIELSNIESLSFEFMNWAILVGTTGNAEDSCTFNVGVLTGLSGDIAVQGNGRVNLYTGLCRKRNFVNSGIWFVFNDFSKIEVGRAQGLENLANISIASTKNIQINAPDVGFDLTNTGGAAPGGSIVQQRKSSFFHMSATANGTLERFNPVYWDVTRLKWVQLTNTTLLSA
jgi:hypothetical protein